MFLLCVIYWAENAPCYHLGTVGSVWGVEEPHLNWQCLTLHTLREVCSLSGLRRWFPELVPCLCTFPDHSKAAAQDQHGPSQLSELCWIRASFHWCIRGAPISGSIPEIKWCFPATLHTELQVQGLRGCPWVLLSTIPFLLLLLTGKSHLNINCIKCNCAIQLQPGAGWPVLVVCKHQWSWVGLWWLLWCFLSKSDDKNVSKLMVSFIFFLQKMWEVLR